CVGEPIASHYLEAARATLDGATVVASHAIRGRSADSAQAARVRAAIDTHRFEQIEFGLGSDGLLPLTGELITELESLVAPGVDVALAIVTASFVAEQEELDWIELWSVASPLDQHRLNEALSAAFAAGEAVFQRAEMTWRGTKCAILHGDQAKRFLMQQMP